MEIAHLPRALAPPGARWAGALARLDPLRPPRRGPGDNLASFPPLGVPEGVGTLFGSLAELMPEEQTTLAGILRLWAGLFVACGFGPMVVGCVLG